MNGDRSVILPPHLQAGKVATAELVSAFGGQVAAAEETGKSQPRISVYCHRNTPDFAPLDFIDTLEARTVGLPGYPHVTRWLARRRGFGLVQLPNARSPETVWSALVSALAKEAGALMSGVCADLADDNDVSPREAGRRLPDAAELVRVAIELEHALKMRAADEPGRG